MLPYKHNLKYFFSQQYECIMKNRFLQVFILFFDKTLFSCCKKLFYGLSVTLKSYKWIYNCKSLEITILKNTRIILFNQMLMLLKKVAYVSLFYERIVRFKKTIQNKKTLQFIEAFLRCLADTEGCFYQFLLILKNTTNLIKYRDKDKIKTNR